MTEIDPFLREVIRHAFDAIADNMALTLMRTSHSGIVRDSLDFSTALSDATGQTIAQGVCTPMHLGCFHDAVSKVVKDYQGQIYPGDIFIFNDPFVAAGQHLPDIYITMPVFHSSKVVAWATALAHHSDVGGIVAGSNALGAYEIFQEGLRLPIVKFLEKGKPNQALWDVISLNVRTPDKVIGDLQAQIASCKSCERELLELFQRYGAETVLAYADHLQDYAEQLTRSEIREVPDGVYYFTDHIDGLGENPEPVILQVMVTVDDDTVTVDWTGSSDQVPGGINPSFPFTKSCAYAALRSILSADIPNCEGFARPITVKAPFGSVLNPKFPAPCGARGITGYRMIDCLFGALATAMPDSVTADTTGGSTLPTISGYINGKAYVFCETFMGTWGATSEHDGQEGVPHMGANQSNVSVEMIEQDYPIRINQYGFVADSAGAGKYRGGLALMREYEALHDDTVLNVRSDKRDFPPHGLFGGKEGKPSKNILNPGRNDRLLPVLMTEVEQLQKGDVFRHVMAGGGGYGDPLKRDPRYVLKDVIEEKVSIDSAKAEYGVVILESDDGLVIDNYATTSTRQSMELGSQ
ncbi:MAG: methylhydantoinase [Rhodospirillaceae bacterium]|nr:methylhydantoinase [Rhodospirillaceae bacterium]|tara:strand:+ start:2675 stop:4417 length:1743 start_codon:yes stop_codon:yes gene_type:complete